MNSKGLLKGAGIALAILSYLSVGVIVYAALRLANSDALVGWLSSVGLIILGGLSFLLFGDGAHICIVKYRRSNGGGVRLVYAVTLPQYVITNIVFPFL